MTEQKVEEIALKFIQGKATPEEEAWLHHWFEHKGDPQEDVVVIQSTNEHSYEVKARLFASIQKRIAVEKKPPLNRQLTLKHRMRYIAASIFLFLSIGCAILYLNNQVEEPVRYTKLLKNDVGPGGNNATLELSNRETFNLDQAAIGELVHSGGMLMQKDAEGVLSIQVSNESEAIAHGLNAIRTPAGGQYQVKLPDGTKVWLNSSSVIRFSNAFANEFREVELEGEAFFEVSKSMDKDNNHIPFFIVSKNQRIEVLGTRFNVNDYPGESTITTLLEGSVRVYTPDNRSSKILKPGQQSRLLQGKIDVKNVDIESSMAWRNGDFIFSNESLESIMKKIERWYDVEVVYEDKHAVGNFSGAVSRSKNLSEVLKIMEYTGKVKFKIQGRRVIVLK